MTGLANSNTKKPNNKPKRLTITMLSVRRWNFIARVLQAWHR